MKRFITLFLVIVVFAFLSSCSQIRQSLYRLGFRSYKTIYTEDLKAHTKSYTLYRDFSTVAKVKVTHFNRKLFYEYIRGIVNDDPESKKYKRYLDEFKGYDIYYVAMYTPDMTINNLEEKNSFWNVYLSACGRILRPEKIEFVDKSDWRAAWLFNVGGSRWYREYIVKFDKDNCTDKIFTISSFLGSIPLRFK